MRSPVQSSSFWPEPDSDSTALTRAALLTALTHCRQATLALFTDLDASTFCAHAHPDFSPVGWHLGHIARVEAQWILQHGARQAIDWDIDPKLFAADGLPKYDRVHLPPLAHILAVLAAVRSRVFDYLAIAPLATQQRLWWWLVQHESQHAETISLILALQGIGQPYAHLESSGAQPEPSEIDLALGEPVYVPAGSMQMGNDTAIAAIDNERPVQTIALPAYWIDRYPVTWGQYRAFIEAGGYQRSQYWTAAGWAWQQQAQVQQPQYVPPLAAGDRADLYPVCGVSWYEADAYARWRGWRLPTEMEWEKAACWQPQTQRPQPYPWGTEPVTGGPAKSQFCNYGQHVGHLTPVTAYPAGHSPLGCADMLGNVWEWTSSVFQGYPEFTPFPYPGYSAAYFADPHYVLRGGSWATRPWSLRPTFRNWYHPHQRQLFAGFRCARSAV